MSRSRKRYVNDPVAFIDDLVKRNDLGKTFALLDHQRPILELAFAFNEAGILAHDTII